MDIRGRALGEDHPETAESYNNLATLLDIQGRYAEAEPLYRKALDIDRRVLGEDHPETARGYKNLAYHLYDISKYAEAEATGDSAARSYEAARRPISPTGLERAGFMAERSPLWFLAAVSARRGRRDLAWQRIEANLARSLFDDLARPLEPEECRREQDLLAGLQRLEERIIGMASSQSLNPLLRPRWDALRQRREAVQAELIEFETGVDRKYGAAAGKPYDLARIRGQLPADAALVLWLDMSVPLKAADPNGEHWACLVRSQGEPDWVKLGGGGAGGNWTPEDDHLPAEVAAGFHARPERNAKAWKTAAGTLAARRLDPLDAHLGPRDGLPRVGNLIVLTSPRLAGVPVEALLEARTPDRPRYTVSYAPSGTMLAWLRERPRPGRKPGDVPTRLLALGDPLFAEPEPLSTPPPPPPDHGLLVQRVLPGSNAARAGIAPGDGLLRYADKELKAGVDLTAQITQGGSPGPGFALTVWREGKTLDLTVPPGPLGVVLDKRPAAEAIVARRDADDVLRRSRGEAPAPLPGTRREVEAIAGLFDQSETLLGPDASEERIDALAAADQLRRFDVLHLATHGAANAQLPMLSKLLLASDGRSDAAERVLKGLPVYDGQLTAEQILRTWKLDADLVTLSACETGLGKFSGGEGYLGFAQALFLAGARSLVLSLWKVDDTATSLLMTRFYENLLGKRAGLDRPLPKGEALREAKQWLRGLSDDQIDTALSALERGKVRPLVSAPERPQGLTAPASASAPKRFEHPYYWAAFILVGDPW